MKSSEIIDLLLQAQFYAEKKSWNFKYFATRHYKRIDHG